MVLIYEAKVVIIGFKVAFTPLIPLHVTSLLPELPAEEPILLPVSRGEKCFCCILTTQYSAGS